MKKLCMALLTLLPLSAQAADYDVTVCSVQAMNNSDYGFLMPCGGWPSKSNCPNQNWVTWDMSKSQGTAMFSAALTALTTGQSVTIRLDGSSCNGYDITQMVRINK
ncbi:hypothetical protein ONV78_23815 [Hahella sp. CR1]|uniref:hypothetical protein n=1 Tax=Hahella sp. CR1 TaxID=2992807 RepID=UPI0024434DBC|nr:hypothetical protein [Hahella sp. CR1]MDG9670786.1 hypothetical protein [Hahella sp. CR1]